MGYREIVRPQNPYNQCVSNFDKDTILGRNPSYFSLIEGTAHVTSESDKWREFLIRSSSLRCPPNLPTSYCFIFSAHSIDFSMPWVKKLKACMELMAWHEGTHGNSRRSDKLSVNDAEMTSCIAILGRNWYWIYMKKKYGIVSWNPWHDLCRFIYFVYIWYGYYTWQATNIVW